MILPARGGWGVAGACLLSVAAARPLAGQAASGSFAATVAGGALGAYSGLFLGLVGSTIPCTQTARAVRCIQISAMSAAATASVSGTLLGSADDDRIRHAIRNTGIGAAAGALTGVALARFTQRVGARDVVALGLVGGAVGAAPRGTGIGLAGGAAVAGLLMAVADLGLPNALAIAAAGIAVGGLAQWILDAHDARSSPGAPAGAVATFRVAL